MLSDKKTIVLHYFQIFLCSVGLLISVVPIACFLIAICIYRGCVARLLKWQHGVQFGGLLKHHDALWAVEEENSLSVVHSLILCECEREESTSQDLYNVLMEKVRGWMTEPSLRKMFQQRRNKYGYSYLVTMNDVQLKDYVKLVDVPSKDDFVTEEDLRKWIAELYNVKLPGDNSHFLEILVSRKAFQGSAGGQVLFPVLIRIHHSLADGVVIVKLLTTSNIEVQAKVPEPQSTPSSSTPVSLILKSAFRGLLTLPQMILRQRMTKPDFNSIHNDKSSEKNFVYWFFEQPARDIRDDVGLLHKIKKIKAVESETTFQDVLCASLSVSLYHHFSSAKSDLFTEVPAQITIGNAVQLGENQRLNNNCAYNFEGIPITPRVVGRGELVAMLREIRRSRAEAVRFQQINYMMIRIGSLLPERFLKRLLTKNRCSLGMSNIPGPSNVLLGGPGSEFSIRHLTFWTPNRFKTRLGLSVFTLQNRLHLGMGGDSCSFEGAREPAMVLKGMVDEINRMYEIVTRG